MLRPFLKQFLPPVVANRRYLVDAVKQLRSLRDIELVSRNKRHRDKYRGQRCFVVGNASSLSQLDLKLLEGEHLLTANGFIFQDACRSLKPLVHTMVDPVYFDPKDAHHQALEDLGRLPACATEFFFPITARSVVERRLPNTFHTNYLVLAGDMTLHGQQKTSISGCIPTYQTVAAISLLIALYMGFSKIYIIGCDLDLLSNVVSVDPLIIRMNHFYSPNTTMNYSNYGWDYKGLCVTVVSMIESFAHAGRQAAPDQEILNAGVGGYLEIFRRVPYESLFSP